MRKVITLLLVIASLTVLPIPASQALPQGTRVQRYKGNLNFAVDFAWVPGTKKFFFTEKNTGKIRVMVRGHVRSRACYNLDVWNDGESGALGIALHPRFKRNHWLYVYYTKRNPRRNRVVRFKVHNNRCRRFRLIADWLGTSDDYHQGGQLEFMNGKLFISVGDAHDANNAQDTTNNRLGKILRVNPDGSIPDGNPFDNRVWAYGIRNPFGLAAHPKKTWLFESENGPSCDDELNRILKGRNYGWGPGYDPTFCGTAGVGTNPKGPLRRWTPTIVPTDLWWYRGRMNSLSGRLYMGDFGTGRLHRFRLGPHGGAVRGHSIVFNASSGIVDVTKGPRGWLYFATPSAIFRIVPN